MMRNLAAAVNEMPPIDMRRHNDVLRTDNLPYVLIVDDHEFNVLLACSALEGRCIPLLARCGEQALQMAREHLPELVLLDVCMPEMDGLETYRQLRLIPHMVDVPVMFVSAIDHAGHEERGLSLGAIDYIYKPFKASLLRARVQNHLNLYRRHRQLQQLTRLDALTGIANRRVFDALLASEWTRLYLLQQPLTLLMIDVDQFKVYNDRCGHLMGDSALRRIALSIEGCMLRRTDLAARYGGEEFVCLLPNLDETGMRHIAYRICEAVAELNIEHPASTVAPHITVSIGGASWIPGHGVTPQILLAQADACLYRAKHAGRARAVCLSEDAADGIGAGHYY